MHALPVLLLEAALCTPAAPPGGGKPAPEALAPITDVAALVKAVNGGSPGDRIAVGPGTFELTEPLRVESGMTLAGAGPGETALTPAPTWTPAPTDRPDNETDYNTADESAYLIVVEPRAQSVMIRGLTLRSTAERGGLHGAILSRDAEDLTLRNLHVGPFRWSGVRLFHSKGGSITDCRFTDAGGRMRVTKGPVGGSIFVRWAHGLEIAHNTFEITPDHPDHVYGVKGRGARDVRIHHNTIRCNFAIEFPFEGESGMEIDHNYLDGVVSIPKHAGGPVPEDGSPTFHLHHNYFMRSYSIEGTRNALVVERNLFDFDPAVDGGNLMASFGRAAAPGPVTFRDNLVRNPGRGVFWSDPAYDRLSFRNNHVVGVETATPRTEGLFGIDANSDFSTIEFVNNRVELTGPPRPLVRNEASLAATFENNRLTGVSDADRTSGPRTDAAVGPREPLEFRVGARGEYRVDGFSIAPVEPADADPPAGGGD
ncbi:right-handed parallel beta-helix repeat-containing protein [Alienimonas sp. DA493]|uniref:right-handed parallel beta-helix repeat-containing protein n=1 Tax=Alienimonas sp. DA493 TaxID=3373605 RepID=UPI0037552F0B